jgi:hypothetical protein
LTGRASCGCATGGNDTGGAVGVVVHPVKIGKAASRKIGNKRIRAIKNQRREISLWTTTGCEGSNIKSEAYANFIEVEKFFILLSYFLVTRKATGIALRSPCGTVLPGKTLWPWRIYFTSDKTDAVTAYKILFNE